MLLLSLGYLFRYPHHKRAKSREQRAEDRGQRAESREQRAKIELIIIRKLSFLSLETSAIFSHIPHIPPLGYREIYSAKSPETVPLYQVVISQDVAQSGVAGRCQKNFFARGGFIEKITTFVDVLSLEH